MQDHTFIKETPNHQKIRILGVTLLSILAAVGLWIALKSVLAEIVGAESLEAAQGYVIADMASFTAIGLFYWGFISGLFFTPVPVEILPVLYFKGLLNGNSPLFSLFLQFAALVPAHAIDYYLGRKFSPAFLNFISKRKVYKAKRWINAYGSYAVFLFNVLPLPAPILTFALGIARYNILRLSVLFLLGNAVKYLAIIWIFSLTQ
ncbi:TPA: hypothetical protein HA281_03280 [Candidatus Woesearchaeota archaeon]|nr:MAG: hypothetical protein QT04_C0044G0009 [archaeon GW2011_AR11]HIH05450.1 hypothetical protein [Candidatus Woesearchaeota archaeon]HIH91798.1 hypothetical protein [Candidatus Woesearchaeota archaeon]HII65285.1 hypothetical protein [Candidatus Woesearchaeota archaeon]HIJ19298.1 hypothetical protein [Candidatus Woesearchaeota archaeon]